MKVSIGKEEFNMKIICLLKSQYTQLAGVIDGLLGLSKSQDNEMFYQLYRKKI